MFAVAPASDAEDFTADLLNGSGMITLTLSLSLNEFWRNTRDGRFVSVFVHR